MKPRLSVLFSGEFSTHMILDLPSKKTHTSKGNSKLKKPTSKKIHTFRGNSKLKKLNFSEHEENVIEIDEPSQIKHLVAKKFAANVPKYNTQVPQIVLKRNAQVPQTVPKPKVIRNSFRPKSLSCYRQLNSAKINLDSKLQINLQDKTTLDELIPPWENYTGFNNPFSSQFKETSSKFDELRSSVGLVPLVSDKNEKKDETKKVCVKGRMMMENGNMRYLTESEYMKYLTECELPFSVHAYDERASVETPFDKKQDDQQINIEKDQSLHHIFPIDEDNHAQVTHGYMFQINGDSSNERSSRTQSQAKTIVSNEKVDRANAKCISHPNVVGKDIHIKVLEEIPVDHILCDHCPAMFNSQESFENHVKNNCGKSPKKVLSDEFSSKSVINDKESLLGRKTASEFLCENCPTFFNSGHSLSVHTESHENWPKTEYLCEKCPTMWYSREVLKSHCDRDHGPNTSCLSGSATHGGLSENLLKNHIRSSCGRNGLRSDKVKSGENATSFLCNICHRYFYDERGLNLHSLVHRRKKTFRKSSRILANNLMGDENDKRIHSKTSAYKYGKKVSEYYNKDEQMVCAKSFKKIKKHVTTWRGKEKKNGNIILVKKTRTIKKVDKMKSSFKIDIKMEKSDFLKKEKGCSRRTSPRKQKRTPKMKQRQEKVDDSNEIEMDKNDIQEKNIEIELIEISSDDDEKDPLMIDDEPELIEIDS